MKDGTEEIIRDTTIIYTDGLSEWFEVIHLTKNGAVIGRIINGTIIACGFIPKENIKEIKNGNRRV